MRTARIPLALIVLVAIGAGCSEDEGRPPALPSSRFPADTGGTTGATGAVPSGETADGPSRDPGNVTGNLSSGEVRLHVTGDVEADTTLRVLISASYSPPTGGLAIVWTAGGTDASTVGIGGASFTGSQPTSPSLSLTITVQNSDGFASFLSIDGECEVAIVEASVRTFSGRFGCRDLTGSSGEVVDVSASFSATG